MPLNPGEVSQAMVIGAMHFKPNEIYQILARVINNEYVKNKARKVYETAIKSRKPGNNFEDIRKLKDLMTKNSRYLNLYLTLMIQYDNDKFVTKKILYDHILFYQKDGVRDAPFSSVQLNSLFPRQNEYISVTL